jgi:hypothetical protein
MDQSRILIFRLEHWSLDPRFRGDERLWVARSPEPVSCERSDTETDKVQP